MVAIRRAQRGGSNGGVPRASRAPCAHCAERLLRRAVGGRTAIHSRGALSPANEALLALFRGANRVLDESGSREHAIDAVPRCELRVRRGAWCRTCDLRWNAARIAGVLMCAAPKQRFALHTGRGYGGPWYVASASTGKPGANSRFDVAALMKRESAPINGSDGVIR